MSWAVVFLVPVLTGMADGDDSDVKYSTRRVVGIVGLAITLALVAGLTTIVWGDDLTAGQAIAVGIGAEGTIKGLIAAGKDVNKTLKGGDGS